MTYEIVTGCRLLFESNRQAAFRPILYLIRLLRVVSESWTLRDGGKAIPDGEWFVVPEDGVGRACRTRRLDLTNVAIIHHREQTSSLGRGLGSRLDGQISARFSRWPAWSHHWAAQQRSRPSPRAPTVDQSIATLRRRRCRRCRRHCAAAGRLNGVYNH